MPLTPVIELDYGALLNEARAIYHQVSLGGGVRVFVDQNGERIEYSATNLPRLAAYIVQLEARLGIADESPLQPYM